MADLQWNPISEKEAIYILDFCYNNPKEVLDALREAKMTGPGYRAPQVRTPYRVFRFNANLQMFETALIP